MGTIQSKAGVGKITQNRTVSSAKTNRSGLGSKTTTSSTQNGQILKNIKNKETEKQGKGIKMSNANSLVSGTYEFNSTIWHFCFLFLNNFLKANNSKNTVSSKDNFCSSSFQKK